MTMKKYRFEPGCFVTSDTHFFHENIIKYSNRPFDNVDDMNEGLISAWNARIGPENTVYHLGDVAMGKRIGKDQSNLVNILNRLNGKIILVRGNHDDHLKDNVLSRFDSVEHYINARTPVKNQKGRTVMCVMFHFAQTVWAGSHHDSWALFGHSHGSLPETGMKSFDVGVDTVANCGPYSYEEIEARMSKLINMSVDHH